MEYTDKKWQAEKTTVFKLMETGRHPRGIRQFTNQFSMLVEGHPTMSEGEKTAMATHVAAVLNAALAASEASEDFKALTSSDMILCVNLLLEDARHWEQLASTATDTAGPAAQRAEDRRKLANKIKVIVTEIEAKYFLDSGYTGGVVHTHSHYWVVFNESYKQFYNPWSDTWRNSPELPTRHNEADAAHETARTLQCNDASAQLKILRDDDPIVRQALQNSRG